MEAEKTNIPEQEQELPTAVSEPVIDFREAQVLRRELVVLRDVDLRVFPSEMVYLMGRVGSGKSTLLKTIYAEVPLVHARRARVFDVDLTTLQRKQIPFLRRRIGIVFQDFQLLHDRSVHDNLEFVLRATGWRDRNVIDERIEHVLARVGMANKSYKMPGRLSGGEQQRVAIARALLNDPHLILADEPTGNLDPETGELIAAMLAEIAAGGSAVIMATHNPKLPHKFPGRVLSCAGRRLT